jgi:hypothetical protein
MFAWTLPLDQPYVYAAWLAEYLFYLLYHLGQLELVIATRTILIGIAVWLVAIEARRRSGSWRIAALVITLLCVIITNNLPVRTQMFAWIPFVITYLVLKRYSEGKCSPYYLVLCPLLMLFWVNVHGSYILGLVLFAAFLAGAIISRFLKQSDALGWTQVAWIGTAGVFTALATLVNPRFTGIIGYTVKLLTDPSSQKLIEEWQSPTPKGFANIFFFISILLFIVVLAISKYQLSPTEIILTPHANQQLLSGQRKILIEYQKVQQLIFLRFKSAIRTIYVYFSVCTIKSKPIK